MARGSNSQPYLPVGFVNQKDASAILGSKRQLLKVEPDALIDEVSPIFNKARIEKLQRERLRNK